MPHDAPSTPAGTTIVIAGVTFGEIIGLSFSGAERSSIDVTHFGTTMPASTVLGGRKFIPGDLADPGELTAECHFDADSDMALDDFGSASCVITWKGVTGSTWTFNAWPTGWTMNAPENDKMVCTITMKIEQSVSVA